MCDPLEDLFRSDYYLIALKVTFICSQLLLDNTAQDHIS